MGENCNFPHVSDRMLITLCDEHLNEWALRSDIILAVRTETYGQEA